MNMDFPFRQFFKNVFRLKNMFRDNSSFATIYSSLCNKNNPWNPIRPTNINRKRAKYAFSETQTQHHPFRVFSNTIWI